MSLFRKAILKYFSKNNRLGAYIVALNKESIRCEKKLNKALKRLDKYPEYKDVIMEEIIKITEKINQIKKEYNRIVRYIQEIEINYDLIEKIETAEILKLHNVLN